MFLNNEEMMNICGGGLRLKLFTGVLGGLAVFIIGVVDGLVNPKRCN